ncbi:hypothetical protein EJ06DRAFT_236637 [Trichodelitschia bisporula]|uniref:Uncharacterized protein n=1 Tax=Trichodelitschia bisporula TaxID=703511 RepID=A0A6G1HJY5_9PEZI|nr:hypothetical protein EJ06DRAFT_236637 [Trichodelitschia bisporula]
MTAFMLVNMGLACMLECREWRSDLRVATCFREWGVREMGVSMTASWTYLYRVRGRHVRRPRAVLPMVHARRVRHAGASIRRSRRISRSKRGRRKDDASEESVEMHSGDRLACETQDVAAVQLQNKTQGEERFRFVGRIAPPSRTPLQHRRVKKSPILIPRLASNTRP